HVAPFMTWLHVSPCQPMHPLPKNNDNNNNVNNNNETHLHPLSKPLPINKHIHLLPPHVECGWFVISISSCDASIHYPWSSSPSLSLSLCLSLSHTHTHTHTLTHKQTHTQKQT